MSDRRAALSRAGHFDRKLEFGPTPGAAGILLFIDHWLWPYATMIGGGVFVDTGGREAAKVLGLKGKGVRVGSRREFLTAAAAYVCLIATGLLSIGIGLSEAI